VKKTKNPLEEGTVLKNQSLRGSLGRLAGVTTKRDIRIAAVSGSKKKKKIATAKGRILERVETDSRESI